MITNPINFQLIVLRLTCVLYINQCRYTKCVYVVFAFSRCRMTQLLKRCCKKHFGVACPRKGKGKSAATQVDYFFIAFHYNGVWHWRSAFPPCTLSLTYLTYYCICWCGSIKVFSKTTLKNFCDDITQGMKIPVVYVCSGPSSMPSCGQTQTQGARSHRAWIRIVSSERKQYCYPTGP